MAIYEGNFSNIDSCLVPRSEDESTSIPHSIAVSTTPLLQTFFREMEYFQKHPHLHQFSFVLKRQVCQ